MQHLLVWLLLNRLHLIVVMVPLLIRWRSILHRPIRRFPHLLILGSKFVLYLFEAFFFIIYYMLLFRFRIPHLIKSTKSTLIRIWAKEALAFASNYTLLI